MSSTIITNNFTLMKITPSDINEHIQTLKNYTEQCESVLECGVRSCVSTWAFAKGLLDNNSDKKRLVSVDLDYPRNIDNISDILSKEIDFEFIKSNDLLISEEEHFDIIFIDTWHVEGQLKRELEKFSKMCKKYIIMHDTTVDEWKGESIRMNMNIQQQMIDSGFTYKEITTGLWPAIDDFLLKNKNFKILERYINNNGLTILKRIE